MMDPHRETKFIAAVALAQSTMTRAGWDVQQIERARYRAIFTASRNGRHVVIIGRSLANHMPADRWAVFDCVAPDLSLGELEEATKITE